MAKRFRIVASIFMLAATLGASQVANAGEIHLALNGDDRNDGASERRPVATLATAVRRAADRSAKTGEDMAIIVGPGLYRNQTLTLNDQSVRGKLTISGTTTVAADYPAFYGNGSGTWLRYDGHAGRATGLTIRNLRIVDYGTAITLNGDRDDPQGYNMGTVISDNVFARIGSASGKGKSTAAVRLVNSRENVIEDNYFHTIRNYPVTSCAGLHSIYVAHTSFGNKIDRNKFEDFCGSAIKLRDRSGSNEIMRNTFITSDKAAAIEEWFCDLDKNAECTKKTGECPSAGNIASGNRFQGIEERRQIAVRGSRQPRPWCDAAIYDQARFSDR
ncbi:MAG: hypothetical protein ACKVOL_15830 [Novosphingobium sp.]